MRLFDDWSVRLGDRLRGLQSHTLSGIQSFATAPIPRDYSFLGLAFVVLIGCTSAASRAAAQHCLLRDCPPLQPHLVRADDATTARDDATPHMAAAGLLWHARAEPHGAAILRLGDQGPSLLQARE